MAPDRATLGQDQLARLLAVGRALVSELDLESVLNQVLETARELTSARYAALGILDERKAELERFLTVGLDDETRRTIGPLPRGHGVLGELIRNPQPLRLPDVTEHPRSYGFPPGHPPMTTFLGVPVSVRGEAYGNLYLTDKAGGEEFTDSDEQLVIVLSEWAAVAIDNARLYENVARRRAELERAVRGLEATSAISRAVGFETELEPRARADRQARAGDVRGALVPGAARSRTTACAWRRPPASWAARSSARRSRLRSSVAGDGRGRAAPGSCSGPRGPRRPRAGGIAADATSAVVVAARLPRPSPRRPGRARPDARRARPSTPRTSTCSARSRRAPRSRSRRRSRWRPTGCATRCERPRRSARAGRASCTTRRCRSSAP